MQKNTGPKLTYYALRKLTLTVHATILRPNIIYLKCKTTDLLQAMTCVAWK